MPTTAPRNRNGHRHLTPVQRAARDRLVARLRAARTAAANSRYQHNRYRAEGRAAALETAIRLFDTAFASQRKD